MNDENNEVGSVDTTYNWDDRNDDWWGDYTNFENLVLTCGAQGGRPEPTFIWYIENNQVNIDSLGYRAHWFLSCVTPSDREFTRPMDNSFDGPRSSKSS